MEEIQKPTQVARKWLWLSILANILLLVLAGGAILFAVTLSYDLQDTKIHLDKIKDEKRRVEAYLAESRARVNEVEREIKRLSQALNAPDPAQLDSGKPKLPVKVHFRKSYLGIGLVAVIENTSERYLTMVLTTRNPTTSTAKRFQIEIKPQDDVAFGHDDGWKFTSGDELNLYNDNYKAFKVKVP